MRPFRGFKLVLERALLFSFSRDHSKLKAESVIKLWLKLRCRFCRQVSTAPPILCIPRTSFVKGQFMEDKGDYTAYLTPPWIRIDRVDAWFPPDMSILGSKRNCSQFMIRAVDLRGATLIASYIVCVTFERRYHIWGTLSKKCRSASILWKL